MAVAGIPDYKIQYARSLFSFLGDMQVMTCCRWYFVSGDWPMQKEISL